MLLRSSELLLLLLWSSELLLTRPELSSVVNHGQDGDKGSDIGGGVSPPGGTLRSSVQAESAAVPTTAAAVSRAATTSPREAGQGHSSAATEAFHQQHPQAVKPAEARQHPQQLQQTSTVQASPNLKQQQQQQQPPSWRAGDNNPSSKRRLWQRCLPRLQQGKGLPSSC